jgi:hypothetical protein
VSKYNNVNPASTPRARAPGDGILHEVNRERVSIEEHRLREEAKKKNKKESPDTASGSE